MSNWKWIFTSGQDFLSFSSISQMSGNFSNSAVIVRETDMMNENLKLNKANDLAPFAAQRLRTALHISIRSL